MADDKNEENGSDLVDGGVIRLTKSEKWILSYLDKRGICSPTQIGTAYGDHLHGNNSFHNYHSAWASPKCKKLVEKGLLKRTDNGHYLKW